jgi:uncharacterized protein (TIGR02147 family)
MASNFFQFPSYRDFLKDRFAHLKATKRGFSARSFANRAGINSPSYFGLVASGRRRLSLEYAEKFAVGLGLSGLETECLKAAVALEHCRGPRKQRDLLLKRLGSLRQRVSVVPELAAHHLRILSDPLTLKLYLLAQSHKFQLNTKGLAAQLPRDLPSAAIESRVAALLDSGLWRRDGQTVRTIAPTVRTGDDRAELHLNKTHVNLLAAARKALDQDPASARVFGGRTFLCDRVRIPEIQERIEAFKRDLEAEFETFDATSVFQLHLAFFELEKPR